MPNGEIQVSFAAVEAAGQDIKSTQTKMVTELDTLKQQIGPLREAYEGAARDAWDAVQTRWNQAQDELNQVLAQIGAAVSQAAEDYRATEHGVQGLWG